MTTSYHNKIMSDIYGKNDEIMMGYSLAIKHLDAEIDQLQKDRDNMRKEVAKLRQMYQEFEVQVKDYETAEKQSGRLK